MVDVVYLKCALNVTLFSGNHSQRHLLSWKASLARMKLFHRRYGRFIMPVQPSSSQTTNLSVFGYQILVVSKTYERWLGIAVKMAQETRKSLELSSDPYGKNVRDVVLCGLSARTSSRYLISKFLSSSCRSGRATLIMFFSSFTVLRRSTSLSITKRTCRSTRHPQLKC